MPLVYKLMLDFENLDFFFFLEIYYFFIQNG